MVLTRRLVRVNAELNVYQSNRSLQNRHWLERRAQPMRENDASALRDMFQNSTLVNECHIERH